MVIKGQKINLGFTLVELIVAIAIFTVIMTVSMGSILGVFDANRKSRSLKTVLNNLNIAVESMSKELRFGKNYDCGWLGAGQNCSSGGFSVSFLSSDNIQITYLYNSAEKRIEKRKGTGESIPITAPEVVIDDATFYVLGAGISGADATLQPKVIMKIKGHAGNTGKGRSDFTLQTMVSQRTLDI